MVKYISIEVASLGEKLYCNIVFLVRKIILQVKSLNDL